MIKRLPPKEPVPRAVENIEEWFEDYFDDDETSAEELDAFLKTAEVDAEFTDLIESDYLGIATRVAEHKNVTPATLSYLLEIISVDWSKAGYVMQAIAQQPQCTTGVLETLFHYGDKHVRESVVAHPNANQEIFLSASQDKNDSVRYRLTYHNPNVPDTLLSELAANDRDEIVRLTANEALHSRQRERDRR